MCGRYTVVMAPEEFEAQYECLLDDPALLPRYNLAPEQRAPVIVAAEGRRTASGFFWGLVPPWAEDASVGRRMINARVETLDQKRSFRPLVQRRRCLVPADGFYEWRTEPRRRRKTPLRFVLRERAPFAMAGLWTAWPDSRGDERRTFTVVTTRCNALVEPVHDRMPVILRPDDWADWLDPDVPFDRLRARVAEPFDADAMEAYEVSPAVNNARHDAPDCIAPAPAPPPDLFG